LSRRNKLWRCSNKRIEIWFCIRRWLSFENKKVKYEENYCFFGKLFPFTYISVTEGCEKKKILATESEKNEKDKNVKNEV
jgi:hypothetical protein